ncbi:hypothetical protein OROMI_032067 [Orobanche minor]
MTMIWVMDKGALSTLIFPQIWPPPLHRDFSPFFVMADLPLNTGSDLLPAPALPQISDAQSRVGRGSCRGSGGRSGQAQQSKPKPKPKPMPKPPKPPRRAMDAILVRHGMTAAELGRLVARSFNLPIKEDTDTYTAAAAGPSGDGDGGAGMKRSSPACPGRGPDGDGKKPRM